MTVYRWYHCDDVRDMQADILDKKPKYINVCGCPLNHTVLGWYINDPNYIFTAACKTKTSAAYTIEEFMALNKKESDSMKIYHWPFEDASSGARNLRIDTEAFKNVEICSCPLNHAYTFNGVKSPRPRPFFCRTKTSWSGPIKDLLSESAKVKPLEDAKILTLTPKEEVLIRYIRSIYETPPDKNIIAALMMTQWIRAQRMPFESDRLIELYDAPKKKGIV